MTAHFKPPRTARRRNRPWNRDRRPANVLQFRARRPADGLREWWPFVAAPLAVFAAVLAWPSSQPTSATNATESQPVAGGATSPWAGGRSAGDLDAEQPRMDPLSGSMPQDGFAAAFAICGGGTRFNCIVDGDTFWFSGEKIRIADINTPEVSSPRCSAEAALGARATRRLAELLNAGAFSLEPVDRDRDRYGRKLRVVTRSGESLGAVLVAEGLAERWQGYRRDWC